MSGLVSGPRINPCISEVRGIAAGPKHGRIARSNAERKADCLRRIQRIFDNPAVLGGVWTCDPGYVRQDSTGTTAAAVGAPVGLVLDQSRGMALGPQLVDNGTFDSNINGWTPGGASPQNAIWSSGRAYCDTCRITAPVSCVSGTMYELLVSISSSVSSNVIRFGSDSTGATGNVLDTGLSLSSGSYIYIIAATAATMYITVGNPGSGAYFDDISVRVFSGRHGIQSTTAKKPRYNRWPNTDIGWCMTETDSTSLLVTFPSSLGSACYRARAGVNGIKEYFGQTIGTTLNLVDGPLFAEVVLNRAPTDYERRVILAWLRFYVPMAQPSLAAVQAIYAQGAVGGVWLPVEGALFTDTTGTTAATVGSSIGLVFDQSQSMALGSEKITNGTFYTDTTGWTLAGAQEITVDSGYLKITSAATGGQGAYQAYTAVVGRTYILTGTITNGTATSSSIRVYETSPNGSLISESAIVSAASPQNVQLFFVATKTTVAIYPRIQASAIGQTGYFDNISVREVSNTPALQSNASYRPTIRQAPESRVWFSDVSPASPALTATFASTVGATCTAFRVTPNGVRKAVVSVSTSYNILDGQYTYWGGKVLVNRATTADEDAAILTLMDQFVPRLGANLVPNGTFDAELASSWAGWTTINAPPYPTQTGGVGVLPATSTTTPSCGLTIAKASGYAVRVSVDMWGTAGPYLFLSNGYNYSFAFGNLRGGSAAKTYSQVANVTASSLFLYAFADVAPGYYDNVIVQYIL